MRNRCVAFAICGLVGTLGAAAPVDAAPLLLDFVGVGRAQVVSVAGVRTGTFWAGELNWNWASPTPQGWTDDFYTYCVDLLNNVTYRQSVEIQTMSEKVTTSPLVTGGNLRAAWLFNEYAADVHAMAPAAGGSVAGAALQLAIWEVLYDNDFSLQTLGGATGFRVTSASSSVLSTAGSYLETVRQQKTLTANAVFLNSPGPTGQDQMTHSVPEPGTLLLMGVSAACLAIRRRTTRT